MPTPQALASLKLLLGGGQDRTQGAYGPYGYSTGSVPTQGELESPYEREQTARAAAADAADRKRFEETLRQKAEQAAYMSPGATDMRRSQQQDKLAQLLAVPQQQGRNTLAVEREHSRGALDVAQATAGGVIGAARARAGGGGNMASSMKERVAGTQTSLDVLGGLEGQFKDTYVGPAVGRARAFSQTLPLLPVDKGFARFSADSSTLKNAVVKAITGAQMSEPEAKRIMEQVPLVTDKPEVWRAKAESTRENLSNMLRRIGDLSGGMALAPDDQNDDPYSNPNWGR